MFSELISWNLILKRLLRQCLTVKSTGLRVRNEKSQVHISLHKVHLPVNLALPPILHPLGKGNIASLPTRFPPLPDSFKPVTLFSRFYQLNIESPFLPPIPLLWSDMSSSETCAWTCAVSPHWYVSVILLCPLPPNNATNQGDIPKVQI